MEVNYTDVLFWQVDLLMSEVGKLLMS